MRRSYTRQSPEAILYEIQPTRITCSPFRIILESQCPLPTTSVSKHIRSWLQRTPRVTLSAQHSRKQYAEMEWQLLHSLTWLNKERGGKVGSKGDNKMKLPLTMDFNHSEVVKMFKNRPISGRIQLILGVPDEPEVNYSWLRGRKISVVKRLHHSRFSINDRLRINDQSYNKQLRNIPRFYC